MALSDERIKELWDVYRAALPRYLCFAKAIEAEVRKQDEALIRQLVASLEGYRRNHNDNQPCDAEREGRAWLGSKPCA